MTNYRWVICSLLFFATTINYLDRQVLSLTWEEFIRPEFHWTNSHYGLVTGIFSLVYAIAMLFAGRVVDRLDTKKGYFWSIGIWSVGACLHAICGVATEWVVDLPDAAAMRAVVDNAELISRIAVVSLTLFILARGHGRVLPQEGPCLCHEYLQRGIYRRGSGCAVPHPDAGGALRLGGLVHHHRSAGLRMDGFLAVPIQETRPESRGQCRRAGVYKFRLGARKARLGVGARPEGVTVALLRIPSDVGLHLG